MTDDQHTLQRLTPDGPRQLRALLGDVTFDDYVEWLDVINDALPGHGKTPARCELVKMANAAKLAVEFMPAVLDEVEALRAESDDLTFLLRAWYIIRPRAVGDVIDGVYYYRCSCGGRWTDGEPEVHACGCIVDTTKRALDAKLNEVDDA